MASQKQRTVTHYLLTFATLLLAQYSYDTAEAVECSPFGQYVFLTKKETHCFQLPSAATDEPQSPPPQMRITFLGIESLYFIPQTYTFFPPNVSVICECACDELGSTCSSNTYYKHDKCNRHRTTEHICTAFYKEGIDPAVCPVSIKLCCQVYFAIPKGSDNKYHGIYLNRHDNTMQMSLSVNITKGNEVHASSFRIPKHVRRFQFNNDSVITLFVISPNEAVPDDWYFIQEGSPDLMTGIHINRVGEQDLRKLGWFQMGRFGPDGKEELLSLDSQLLDPFLRIHPLKCHTDIPKYSWEFHAKYFHKNGVKQSPIIGKPVLQVYGRFISNVTVDLNRQNVVVDHRNPPELRMMVSESKPLEEDLIYSATVYADKEGRSILTLVLLSGKKITYLVNVGNGQHEGSEDFYVTVYKSQHFPVQHTFKLQEKVIQPVWICIYEENDVQKQLCRLIEIINEPFAANEALLADSAIQLNADGHSEAKESSDSSMMVLVVLAICLALLSLVINAFFLFLFCRRRLKDCQDSFIDSLSMNNIKKDSVEKKEKTESDSTRYSHLYESLRPTQAVQPTHVKELDGEYEAKSSL